MYIYLSDRKRRSYLSQRSPQNLSPKKSLSLKDRRFLQKNVANLQDPITFRLVKQQKVLYSKYIGSYLESKFSNMQKSYGGENIPPLYLQVWEKEFNAYKTHAYTSISKYPKTEKREGQVSIEKEKNLKTDKTPFIFKEKKPTQLYAFSPLSIYVQSIKTYTQKWFRDMQNQTLFSKNKHPHSAKKRQKIDLYKACLEMPFLAFSICKTLASAPLYANGKSLYLYSRYLYNIESLKASIMPQVLKNQKTASRHKYVLQERKKIALLYGQLAKKDMQTLIKTASALPGLFEDNLFTLLESRVDVLVYRAGFSNSIAGARQLLRNGSFYINGKRIYSSKTRAFPGDFFALGSKKSEDRDLYLYNCYMHTTEQFYNLYKEFSSKTYLQHKDTLYQRKAEHILKVENTPFLYMPLFLYKNLCKKISASWLFKKETFAKSIKSKCTGVHNKIVTERVNASTVKNVGTIEAKILSFTRYTKKRGPWYMKLLNSCSAHILKYKTKERNLFFAAAEKEAIFHRFMKNIQNANSVCTWGQKPLHLEISHKRGCFIYMYRPQKLIFPISLDLHAIKEHF